MEEDEDEDEEEDETTANEQVDSFAKAEPQTSAAKVARAKTSDFLFSNENLKNCYQFERVTYRRMSSLGIHCI